MFCRNCGIDMADDLKFCPKCGTPVDPDELHPYGSASTGFKDRQAIVAQMSQQPVQINTEETQSVQMNPVEVPVPATAGDQPVQMNPVEMPMPATAEVQPVQMNAGEIPASVPVEGQSAEKKKMSTGMIILIVLGALLAIAIAVAGSIFVLRRNHRIDLNEYVEEVYFEGYDTLGYAYVDYDYEKLYERVNKLASDVPQPMGEDYAAWMSSIMEMRFEVVESTSLSNGDEVVLTWDVDEDKIFEEYGIRVKYKEKKYTVEGLEEAELVDIFDGVTVSFNGIEPTGCGYLYRDGKYCNIPMELSKDSGLSNGDVVQVCVVGVNNEQEFAKQYGYVPVGLSKDYTVEGLASYFHKMDEIPQEIIDLLKDQFSTYLEGYIGENWTEDEVLDSYLCVAEYFLQPETDNYSYNEKNVLYLLYQVNMHIEGGKSDNPEHKDGKVTYYMYLRYDNVLKGEDIDENDIRFSIRNFESDVYTRSFLSDKQYYTFVGYESLSAFETEILKEFEKDGYIYESMENNDALLPADIVSANDMDEED